MTDAPAQPTRAARVNDLQEVSAVDRQTTAPPADLQITVFQERAGKAQS